jgi:glycosyltransferase involved in cell wall biosynthesis
MIISQLARACYPFHPYGGLERHVYHLTLELARLGHQVRLYTQPPDPGRPLTVDDPAWQSQVRHFPIPYSAVKLLRRNSIPDRLVNYPLFALKLGRAVHQEQPPAGIVHAHGLAGYGYARRPVARAPLVLNPHGMEEFKGRVWAKQLAYAPFRHLLVQTAAHSAAVIATDAALVPEVERNLKVAAGKVTLIPNAVALDELDREAAQVNLAEMGREYTAGIENPFIFLSVGRLETNKGFDVMLEALGLAREKLASLQPGWRWLVVGSGSQAEKLKLETARLGLAGKVSWLGGVDTPRLHALYQLAAVFVHPTLYEGSSLVTLEALAHRLPVIASRTGGLPDKVLERGEYENGRLCPPGNAPALAERLVELAALPPAVRAILGQQGRKLVEDRFSWPAAALKTVALYESLLK